ncbi:MAG: hypothetical protein E7290_11155 [Lachnospiraceae bacterium]|nr:hypothetical protein [Lachnospiraceae bacterium]
MKNRDVLNNYDETINDEYANRERRRRRRIKEQVTAYVALVIIVAAVATAGTIGVKSLISHVQAYNAQMEQAIADAVEEQSQAIESEEIAKSEALEEALEEASKQAAEAETVAEPEVSPLDELVAGLMQDMTLAEKVAAMFIVTPESITGVGKAVRAGDSTKQAIAANPVGGIVYAEKNYQSDSQFQTMLSNTREYSKFPLFIAAGWTLAEDKKQSFGVDMDLNALKTLVVEGIALNDYQMEIEGLNISGFMNEKVVTDYYSSADAAIAAIQVGVDVLVTPADYKAAYQGVLDAVTNGIIAEERINESVRKIYKVKYRDALNSDIAE